MSEINSADITKELSELFPQSHEAEEEIRQQLKSVGFEVS